MKHNSEIMQLYYRVRRHYDTILDNVYAIDDDGGIYTVLEPLMKSSSIFPMQNDMSRVEQLVNYIRKIEAKDNATMRSVKYLAQDINLALLLRELSVSGAFFEFVTFSPYDFVDNYAASLPYSPERLDLISGAQADALDLYNRLHIKYDSIADEFLFEFGKAKLLLSWAMEVGSATNVFDDLVFLEVINPVEKKQDNLQKVQKNIEKISSAEANVADEPRNQTNNPNNKKGVTTKKASTLKLPPKTITEDDWDGNIDKLTNMDIEGELYGDINAEFHGNIEGGIHGNINAPMYGDVEDDVEGNIEHFMEGNIGGDVYGDINGELHGNIYGDLQGCLNGTVFGNIHGDVSGDITGKITGSIGGDVWGNIEGEVEGDIQGDVMGFVNGIIKGTVFGTIETEEEDDDDDEENDDDWGEDDDNDDDYDFEIDEKIQNEIEKEMQEEMEREMAKEMEVEMRRESSNMFGTHQKNRKPWNSGSRNIGKTNYDCSNDWF